MKQEADFIDRLNALAESIYGHFESGKVKPTRRRLLVLQTLIYFDRNSNSVIDLLKLNPQYVDSAEILLRALYDLGVNVDWVLKDRTNMRLWRWIRDDRHTLLWQIDNEIELRTNHPNIYKKNDDPKVWTDARAKVFAELDNANTKSNTNANEKPLSLYGKVKTFSSKSRRVYHTVFWLFSTKTHGSPTGLQHLLTLDPFYLARRTNTASDKDTEHVSKLASVCLTWYAAQIYRCASYLKTPFIEEARALYQESLKRPT